MIRDPGIVSVILLTFPSRWHLQTQVSYCHTSTFEAGGRVVVMGGQGWCFFTCTSTFF